MMKPKDLPLFTNPQAKKVLQAACASHGVTATLLKHLLEVQRRYLGSGRQMGITQDFDTYFAEFLDDQKSG